MTFQNIFNYIQKTANSLMQAGGVVGLLLCICVMPTYASDMTAYAEPEGNWMVRVRALGVLPDSDSTTNSPGIGVDIEDYFIPELDITYFINQNWALELVLGISKHDVEGTGLIAGADVGDFLIIPPHLMLQYHFHLNERIKPYVGVGVNYSIIFNEDEGPGFTDLDIDNGWGFSLQAGVDIKVKEQWYLNVDVKKTWMSVDATVNNAITADIDVDPWLVGVGLGYRF